MAKQSSLDKLAKMIAEQVRTVIREELNQLNEQVVPKKRQEPTEKVHSKLHETLLKSYDNKIRSNKFTGKFADILNETPPLQDDQTAMNNQVSILDENIIMNSNDAMNFGAARKMMSTGNAENLGPQTMTDPETGKTLAVPDTVTAAITKDYSALMNAINKKKNR